jgi:hypothetical protein
MTEAERRWLRQHRPPGAVLVEFDQSCDVLQELRGNSSLRGTPATAADATAARGGLSRISPDRSRSPLMELMHELVEFERIDVATFPTNEFEREARSKPCL